jgi:hypothetical protein
MLNYAFLVRPGATMLILKYFLVVGIALTVGLFALSARLTPVPVAPATVRAAPTVAPVAVANPEPVSAAVSAEPAPQAPAKATSSSHRSSAGRGKRRPGGVAAR